MTLALPIMASSLLSFLMSLVDLFMVSHLGVHELAAAGLANTYFNTLQHPIVGAATALDTLLSQSFGASQFSAYASWTQSGLLLLLLLSLPFAALLAVARCATRTALSCPDTHIRCPHTTGASEPSLLTRPLLV